MPIDKSTPWWDENYDNQKNPGSIKFISFKVTNPRNSKMSNKFTGDKSSPRFKIITFTGIDFQKPSRRRKHSDSKIKKSDKISNRDKKVSDEACQVPPSTLVKYTLYDE